MRTMELFLTLELESGKLSACYDLVRPAGIEPATCGFEVQFALT
jgi:hypothetical protein